MTLIDVAFALSMVVMIIFVPLFFAEWAEKHTQSYAMKLFAHFGMPALLWCGMLILYAALQQKGLLR